MLKTTSLILFCLALFVSCKETDDRIPVARVSDTFLYQEDIVGLVPEGSSSADSTAIVTSYINRWATQALLVDGANKNLPDEKQADFDKLVQQYKKDLYTKAYLEALVQKNIDTNISDAQARAVYESNRETFKLNEELLQFRYIKIAENAINLDDIEERFRRFEQKDKIYLDSIALQFKSYSLNDSVWINVSSITQKIPVITPNNKDQLLKKSNFIQLKDSLDLYLVQTKDVLFQNDLAPLEYVRPTIKQIVFNKRKLELVKELEKEITKDAIKNKQFEIYN